MSRAPAEIPANRWLAASLAGWFDANARALPWRLAPAGARDPYAVLVSELMLQQTQVSRVVDRYRVFMSRFPTVSALAAADEAEVLALWTGLGYYRRARLLHAAARAVVQRYGAVMPIDPGELRSLPGVGRYTAGAVASIAAGRAEPIVDANVARVLLRLAGRDGVATERHTRAWVWEQAGAMVAAADRPGVFNEALMELGATVCTPRRPRCDGCPLAAACAARATGRQDQIPIPRARATKKILHVGVVLAVDARGRRLVERRGDQGLWAGLWQAPSVERESRAWTATEAGQAVGISAGRLMTRFSHQTTHRDVRFRVWVGTGARAGGGRAWKSRRQIERLALGTPQRRVLLETFDAPPTRAATRCRAARSG